MKLHNEYTDAFILEKYVNEGCSSHTIATYVVVLRALLRYPGIDLSNPKTLNRLKIQEMLMDLHIKNEWTSWTFNRYRKNLKIFFDWLIKNGYLEINPIKDIPKRRESKTLPKVLSSQQMHNVFRAIDKMAPENTHAHIRYKAIFYTYAYTGMRLYELATLTMDHVNLDNRHIRIVRGKGNKDRLVPIPEVLYNILFRYTNIRRSLYTQSSAFFLSESKKPLTRTTLRNIFLKLQSKLDFRITCHMLRHTFATELATKNVNIHSIASILGHSNLQATKIYLHFQTDGVREVIDSIKPYTSI